MSRGSLDAKAMGDYIGNMAQLNVSLPNDLQHHVDARVSDEGYADSADFLRDLIRRDQDAYKADVQRLRVSWAEGIASGIVDAEPEDILEEIIADIPARNAPA